MQGMVMSGLFRAEHYGWKFIGTAGNPAVQGQTKLGIENYAQWLVGAAFGSAAIQQWIIGQNRVDSNQYGIAFFTNLVSEFQAGY